MNIDSKTIGIIMAIAVQSVSLVWFISKMDSRIANNERDMTRIMEMHKDYDKMRKQLDRISWLLDQDAQMNQAIDTMLEKNNLDPHQHYLERGKDMTEAEAHVLRKENEEIRKTYHMLLDKYEEKCALIQSKNQEMIELKYKKRPSEAA